MVNHKWRFAQSRSFYRRWQIRYKISPKRWKVSGSAPTVPQHHDHIAPTLDATLSPKADPDQTRGGNGFYGNSVKLVFTATSYAVRDVKDCDIASFLGSKRVVLLGW